MTANVKSRSGRVGSRDLRAGLSHLSFNDDAHSSDENSLIRQARGGRWEAFAELASHYDCSVLALGLRLAGSEHEARELFQKAFVTAYRELPSYRFQCSFYLWVHRIVAHACMEFLERRRSEPKLPQLTRLGAALEQLSPRERMVVELKQYLGLRLETIASILGVSESVARNTLARAALRLRLECDEQAARSGP